jgi:hypothetical protein
MIVLREVIDEARTYTQDLLLAIAKIFAVYLRLGDLLEVVAVDPKAQPIGQHLIGTRKVRVDRLTGLRIPGT